MKEYYTAFSQQRRELRKKWNDSFTHIDWEIFVIDAEKKYQLENSKPL